MTTDSEKKQGFSWKSFISFFLFFSLIVLLITGVVLYIAPPGRVANWNNWKLFWLSKAHWQAVHTVFSLAFVIFSIFHLFFINWKSFWWYVVSKTKSGLNKGNELVISTVFTLVLFIFTIYNIQPIKAIIDFGEWTTDSWEKTIESPAIPHAELLTLVQVSEKLVQMSPDSIMLVLRAAGIQVDSVNQTLNQISVKNNKTPSDLFKIIGNKATKKESKTQIPSGLGRKTIQEIAELNHVTPDVYIEKLKQISITAKPDDKLKSIAEDNGKTPMEIYEILTK